MKRLMFVLGMLLLAPIVWAQCPTNGIAVNPTNYVLLMPSDAASQGVPTSTLSAWAAFVGGSILSHTLTVTPGTQIAFNRIVQNGTPVGSGSGYYTVDSGTTQYNAGLSFDSNGNDINSPYWLITSSDVGHRFNVFYPVIGTNGGTTQDVVKITVVSGPSDTLVDQDEIPTNLIYQATGSFSGTSSMACGACAQNPQACSNVTHEGRISFELDNLTSGESQVQPMIYGPLVNPTFNNGLTSNPLYLSVLPGDTTQDSQTDQVECSLYGLFYNQSPTNSGTGQTHKQMKTKIKVLQQGTPGTNGPGITRWYVETWCSDTQHTPIWEPLYIDTKGAASILIKEGQYEMSYGDCWAEPGWQEWKCAPMTVTPPQPLTIGVGGTKYDCSTLINTPLPQ